MNKTKLTKSKSTNKPSNLKARTGKQSKSNGDIKPRAPKKRGVYVEKKSSMNRTGTQYPDENNSYSPKMNQKNKINNEENNKDEINPRKKPKYRSKALNANSNELDDVVILQSNKNIYMTPSNYSEMSKRKDSEIIKWSDFLQPLVPNKNSAMIDTTAQHIKKYVNVLDRQDPNTVIADHPPKDDKKMYKFFVDLLESTFDVYNVKTDFGNDAIKSNVSSRVELVIDEAVARTLQKRNDKTNTSRNARLYDNNKQIDSWDDKSLEDVYTPFDFEKIDTSFKRHNKIASQSFNARNKANKIGSMEQTFSWRKTIPTTKRNKKKYFINLLKEELTKDAYLPKEPQNFFQALKAMARNKTRTKSIHFTESTQKTNEGDYDPCMFKRRGLFSCSNKSNKKAPTINKAGDSKKSVKKLKPQESDHSLTVNGFDFIQPLHKNAVCTAKDTIVYDDLSWCESSCNVNWFMLIVIMYPIMHHWVRFASPLSKELRAWKIRIKLLSLTNNNSSGNS